MYNHGTRIKNFVYILTIVIFVILGLSYWPPEKPEPPPPITELPRNPTIHRSQIRKELESYKNMEDDYKWLLNMKCPVHGYSCPSGGVTQSIESGVYILDNNKADIDGFIENIFSNLDSNVRRLLESRLKEISYAKGAAWTKDNVRTNSEVDDHISGTYYVLYSDESPDQPNKRRIFTAVVQNTISAGSGHYFSAEHFSGKRIEHALMYLLYKDVKKKQLI
nr:1822_t:CDS:2 [Entrophospora candida]